MIKNNQGEIVSDKSQTSDQNVASITSEDTIRENNISKDRLSLTGVINQGVDNVDKNQNNTDNETLSDTSFHTVQLDNSDHDQGNFYSYTYISQNTQDADVIDGDVDADVVDGDVVKHKLDTDVNSAEISKNLDVPIDKDYSSKINLGDSLLPVSSNINVSSNTNVPVDQDYISKVNLGDSLIQDNIIDHINNIDDFNDNWSGYLNISNMHLGLSILYFVLVLCLTVLCIFYMFKIFHTSKSSLKEKDDKYKITNTRPHMHAYRFR